MKIIAVLIGTIMLTQVASAKLGETIEEVEARYGKPKASGTDEHDHLAWRKYRYQEYEVIVRYLDGKSACEKLVHRNETLKFSDPECLGVAKAISGEADWSLFDHKGPATAWTCGDNMALRSEITTAEFSPFLEISGKQYRDYTERMRATESAKQVDAIAERFNGEAIAAKK